MTRCESTIQHSSKRILNNNNNNNNNKKQATSSCKLVLTHIVDTGKYRNILVSSTVEFQYYCVSISVNNTGKASIVVYNTNLCEDRIA